MCVCWRCLLLVKTEEWAPNVWTVWMKTNCNDDESTPSNAIFIILTFSCTNIFFVVCMPCALRERSSSSSAAQTAKSLEQWQPMNASHCLLNSRARPLLNALFLFHLHFEWKRSIFIFSRFFMFVSQSRSLSRGSAAAVCENVWSQGNDITRWHSSYSWKTHIMYMNVQLCTNMFSGPLRNQLSIVLFRFCNWMIILFFMTWESGTRYNKNGMFCTYGGAQTALISNSHKHTLRLRWRQFHRSICEEQ